MSPCATPEQNCEQLGVTEGRDSEVFEPLLRPFVASSRPQAVLGWSIVSKFEVQRALIHVHQARMRSPLGRRCPVVEVRLARWAREGTPSHGPGRRERSRRGSARGGRPVKAAYRWSAGEAEQYLGGVAKSGSVRVSS